MKTVGLEEQTRTEAESVLYQIECEDYETALQIAYDLCAKLRTLTSK
jgi:DNA-binding XRE family transcriptional regulator